MSPCWLEFTKKLKLRVAICSFSYLRGNVLFSWWGYAKRKSIFYLPSLFSNFMPLSKRKWNQTTKPEDLLLISQGWTSLTLTLSLRWAYVELSSELFCQPLHHSTESFRNIFVTVVNDFDSLVVKSRVAWMKVLQSKSSQLRRTYNVVMHTEWIIYRYGHVLSTSI